MKKNFAVLPVVLLLLTTTAFAQRKVTKYCVVSGYAVSLLGAHIRVHYGEVDSLFSFKDSSVKRNLQKVSSFKTLPDALNFMGTLGWKLVGMVNDESRSLIRFYFKKTFAPEELEN